MRTIAAIRTHHWGEDAERVYGQLHPVFGDDLVAVFHNRAPGFQPPLPVVDLNDAWVAGHGLRHVPDYGWRCGDYSYYALREAYPDYDAYWLVEPDVYFTSDARPFFAAFDNVTTDALGYDLGPFDGYMRFVRGLTGIPVHRAIFCLTRLSGRAIDQLFRMRQDYSATPVPGRLFTNDELFVFSHAVSSAELSTGRLEDTVPDWFEGSQFTPNPDLLLQQVERTYPAGRVVHPVRGRGSYKAMAAARICELNLLHNMRQQIRELDSAELTEIAELAAQRVEAELRRVWARGRRGEDPMQEGQSE